MGSDLGCYAWGEDGDWEGICLDLDIAVQGESFEEVRTLLNDAIQGYLDSLKGEKPENVRRLLNRRSPFLTRLKFQVPFWINSVRRGERGGAVSRHAHHFSCPVSP
jgi:predicted RNase H-like HicB family nuclease